MEAQASKFPVPLMVIAAVAIILFSAAGVAAIMGWIPTSIGRPADPVAVSAPPAPQASKVAPHKAVQPVQHMAPPVAMANSAPVAQRCNECGTIESTREVDVKGQGSLLGVAGGAAVGGLLGSQVGHGSGNKIATVVGAVGGAVAGNEIEKRVKTTKSYEVTVRMSDGSSRVINEGSAPTWRAGDHVKIIDGTIRSN